MAGSFLQIAITAVSFFSTDGGFVLHSGGLTFSNDSFSDSDTLAVVQAPGAQGARNKLWQQVLSIDGVMVSPALFPLS
ncbi:hypothetical protein ACLK1T_06855 [Escherichia coli]